MNLHKDFPYPLYLVISEEFCLYQSYLKVAEEAIKGGVDIIQLREKNCSTNQFIDKAHRLKDLTTKYNIPLIINDNLEVAISIDAEGIHVGNSDISPIEIHQLWSNKIIGYSLEFLDQLVNQDIFYANYLGISPVFSTKTKQNTVKEWGIEGVKQIRKLTNKPLIGIGDMNSKTFEAVIEAGANSIAVVSAICSAKDPYKEALILKEKLQHDKL